MLKLSDTLSLPLDAATLLAQMEAHTDKSGKCWLWKGYLRNGYGSINRRNSSGKWQFIYIHHVSFAIFHGPVPEGKRVLHGCDVRACWFPDHLFPGTQGDNIRDMWAKGRQSPPPHFFGEKHPLSKLSDEDVALIRSLKGEKQRTLAARFGVSQHTIWNILRSPPGRRWLP